MGSQLDITINRRSKRSLTDQISDAIREAIKDQRLRPGARLPSWDDLAAQLGVARGTIRQAYGRLEDEQRLVAAGAAGTRVAAMGPASPTIPRSQALPGAHDIFPNFPTTASAFQMGVPSQDAFPHKLWARLIASTARSTTAATAYPDPRGEPDLRHELAAYLAYGRGLRCDPNCILITNGYAGALGMLLRAVKTTVPEAWVEDPGYPFARRALELAALRPVPVPVDNEGINVERAIGLAPRASFALVTAGQQAPLGVSLSGPRRLQLLEWAASTEAWIIEDDYLSELQLTGRAAPALASLDRRERVIYVGSFSKTLSPSVRIGFIVAPRELLPLLSEVAATQHPAPAPLLQRSLAAFIREGHYLRHLRRMKQLYGERLRLLCECLDAHRNSHVVAGLSAVVRLRTGLRDTDVAEAARAMGLFPMPLSSWYCKASEAEHGLVLGVTNLIESRIPQYCAALQPFLHRQDDPLHTSRPDRATR